MIYCSDIIKITDNNLKIINSIVDIARADALKNKTVHFRMELTNIMGCFMKMVNNKEFLSNFNIDEEYKLWEAAYLVKGAMDREVLVWHSDYYYWNNNGMFQKRLGDDGYINMNVRTIWIPMCDTNVDNGGLQIFKNYFYPQHPLVPEDIIKGNPNIIDLEVKYGECIVFNEKLMHRSGPNNTDKPRHVLVLRYEA